MAFTIDKAQLQLLGMFQQLTRATAKDLFEDANGTMVFVVPQGELARAIGKGGVNAKRLEQKLRKKVRIIEHSDDLEVFLKKVANEDAFGVKIKNDIVTLIPYDLKVRGRLIGRAATRLRNTESIVQRYFPVRRLVVTQVQEPEYVPPEER